MLNKIFVRFPILLLLCFLFMPMSVIGSENQEQKPIILKTIGSLFFGGTVSHKPNGDTFHGDHAYAQFFIPQKSRNYPLVMWHGLGQSGRSWESTPDGREGFMQIFTRRDWPVYIIDQPRRGRAGYTEARPNDPNAVPTTAQESSAWNAFRNGIWTPPKAAALYPGVQFPQDGAAIEQFFRQQTPSTGEEPMTAEHRAFMGNTMAELLRQIGPSILITHSNSGQYGWAAGMAAPDLVKAIVAYEPGAFAFPEGERLADVPTKIELVANRLQPRIVPIEEFKKLTKMPILIIYGDNISKEPSDIFNVDVWCVASTRARQFVEAVNRHGGNAQLVMLPEIGIRGNTHAPFADLNNLEIADHLVNYLHSQGLDGSDNPHQGPQKKSIGITIPLETTD